MEGYLTSFSPWILCLFSLSWRKVGQFCEFIDCIVQNLFDKSRLREQYNEQVQYLKGLSRISSLNIFLFGDFYHIFQLYFKALQQKFLLKCFC